MRISDWSSDVCSSDLKKDRGTAGLAVRAGAERIDRHRSGDPQYLLMRAGRTPSDNFAQNRQQGSAPIRKAVLHPARHDRVRSEEHTYELQSLIRITYAVFCFNKKKQ